MEKSIFIADDEKEIVDILVEQLGQFMPEYIIDFSFDGEAALNKMLSKKYDVLITDLNMPKMEGNDLIRNLGEKNMEFYPSKIIVMSGYINLHNEKKVIENIHFIEKPYDINEIVAIIKGS